MTWEPDEALAFFTEWKSQVDVCFRHMTEAFERLAECRAMLAAATAAISPTLSYTPPYWKPADEIRGADADSVTDAGCSHKDGPQSTYVKVADLVHVNPSVFQQFKEKYFDYELRDEWDPMLLFAPVGPMPLFRENKGNNRI